MVDPERVRGPGGLKSQKVPVKHQVFGPTATSLRQQRRTEGIWASSPAQDAQEAATANATNAPYSDEASEYNSSHRTCSGPDGYGRFNAGPAHASSHVECSLVATKLEHDDEWRSAQPGSHPDQSDFDGFKHAWQSTNINDSHDFHSGATPRSAAKCFTVHVVIF